MDNRFIMTAYGKDRPGIVADVTRILFENGCNLEDTAMTLLADEFTLVLLFEGPRQDIQAKLVDECQRIESAKGITAYVRPLKERQVVHQSGFETCTLHVEGVDHSGIVYKVSQFLADKGMNIFDLKSTVKEEPGSGSRFYLMDIHIQVPEGTSMAQLEEGLREVEDELAVDIAISR